jgi:hypothetical protein
MYGKIEAASQPLPKHSIHSYRMSTELRRSARLAAKMPVSQWPPIAIPRRSPRLAEKVTEESPQITTLATVLINLISPLFQQLQGTHDPNDRLHIIHDIMTLVRLSRNLLILSPKFRTTLSAAINRLWDEIEKRDDLDPVLKRKCVACFEDLQEMLEDIRSNPKYVA